MEVELWDFIFLTRPSVQLCPLGFAEWPLLVKRQNKEVIKGLTEVPWPLLFWLIQADKSRGEDCGFFRAVTMGKLGENEPGKKRTGGREIEIFVD